MMEAEKDAWILSQAKILPDFKQEDFYKSICGTKKVINMPERTEITGFCEKVKNGDIVVEYDTHYVEFDDYGHFHDDWEHEFYDPDNAMSFISSVIRGCHDLVVLEEFEDAFEILDINMLIEYFGKIGKEEKKPKKSFLRGTWAQIMDLISDLMHEPYIDDQFEIEEIWNIIEALLKRGGFEKEPWEVKEHILAEIYENDYSEMPEGSDSVLYISASRC